jgi:hypothetical protein
MMSEHLSKTGVFAAAIARRYGEVPLVTPLLDMIVRLNPRPSVDRRSLFETRVQVAPHIRVMVNHSPGLAVQDLDPGRPQRWPPPQPIVRRLAERQRRVEPGSPTRSADLHRARVSSLGPTEGPPAPTAVGVAHPGALSPDALPMIVCRRATPTSTGTGGNESRNGGGSPQAFERPAANRTHGDDRRSGNLPPAIDVERLTDKVVRAIDRRIVAYRERTARS